MMDYFRLGEKLNPKPDGESAVRHRTGVVDAVNADGTVDLDLGGIVVPGVSVLNSASIEAASPVQVVAWAGDLLVLGPATPDDTFIRWGSGETLTTVTVSGSQTLIEAAGVLSVRFAGQGAQDYNCILKPHTFTIGDTFMAATRLLSLSTAGQIASAGLIFTDGTVAGSNAVAAHLQYNGGDIPDRVIIRHGTLNAMTTAVTLRITGFYDRYWLRLAYQAANSFLLGLSLDGVGAGSAFGGVAQAKAMTPTHVGVCWSKDNTSGDGLASFGNVRKVA